MENKPNKKGGFQNFVEGKGFYIILAVCLGIIGTSGYVLFNSEPSDPEFTVKVPSSETKVSDVPAGAEIPDVKVSFEETTEKETERETEAEKQPETQPTEAAAVSGETEVEEKVYIPPVIGKVSKSFSNGELVYDETMGDYRTHNGVDIECEEGATVSCFSDGVVEKVYSDELTGGCVIIDHGDGIKSVYKGLDTAITLTEGCEIAAGDAVGCFGNNNFTESEEEPHIHFEVMKDGLYVDPFEFIK